MTTVPAVPGQAGGQSQARHAGPNILVSLAPWIAIWILNGNNTFRLAAGVALVVAVFNIVFEFVTIGRPRLLDWGTLVIIAAICAVAFIQDPTWLAKWLNAIANGGLFLLMLTTVLIGKPFAASYASDMSEEVRRSATFRKITMGISLAWTAALGVMLVGAIITGLNPSTETWSTWVVTVGALILAMRFQSWYPDHVRNSMGAPAPA